MLSLIRRLIETRRFLPSLFGMFVLVGPTLAADDAALIFQREDAAGFLRIERLPDATVVPLPRSSVTMQTKQGMKNLRRISGDCDSILDHLLWSAKDPRMARLVVETKDDSYYSVILDREYKVTFDTLTEIADKLGLEVVHLRRRKLAYVLRANDDKRDGIQSFQGQYRWPEARSVERGAGGLPKLKYGELVPYVLKEFPNGGILFVRWGFDDDNSVPNDDNHYFDGVSFDELAQFYRRHSQVSRCERYQGQDPL